jgi:hypothetical protein
MIARLGISAKAPAMLRPGLWKPFWLTLQSRLLQDATDTYLRQSQSVVIFRQRLLERRKRHLDQRRSFSGDGIGLQMPPSPPDQRQMTRTASGSRAQEHMSDDEAEAPADEEAAAENPDLEMGYEGQSAFAFHVQRRTFQPVPPASVSRAQEQTSSIRLKHVKVQKSSAHM